jgi:3-hydroxyacyl-CoA dehydrogenase/enoyl-CoA hydratase/3-hydroxybutyryl-CoA epimerase
MSERFGARMQPSVTLLRVIESGRLGRKARRGFYKYDEEGKRRGVDGDVYDLTPTHGQRQQLPAEEIQMRTVLPMLNEAVACLEEGIIRSARDGDIGAVFGIGFPPFHGGPFRYIDTLGAREVVRMLDEFAARFPGRFTVTSRLRAMAENDERFHPDQVSDNETRS